MFTRRFALTASIAATLLLGFTFAATEAQPAKKKGPVLPPQVQPKVVVAPNNVPVVQAQPAQPLEKQNGQAGDQGEKQNGQGGDQGEKQNGQNGDQGDKQNGQSGDQGDKGGNAQVNAFPPPNGVVIAQAKNGQPPIPVAVKKLPALPVAQKKK